MDLKEQFKGIKENIAKNKFKTTGNYKFNRYLFQAFMFFVFAYLFFVAWSYDYKLNYFECQDIECENPFYNPVSWENEQYLPNGVYGTKLGYLFYSTFWVAFGGLLLVFFANHWLYNRHISLKIDLGGIDDERNNNSGNN